MELELVFNWVIKSSIMASIMAGLILLVKYALRNKLDVKWQYAIWMLLIIRLLIPYDIQSPWSIYSLLPNNSVISLIVNQIRIPDINAQISNISRKVIQLTNDQSIINKAPEPISKNLSNGWILAILWWVLTTSTKASIFIVFLLGVKHVLRNRMGARFQYMLWSVLIIGLVLPWTPSSPVSAYNFINPSYIQQVLAPISKNSYLQTTTFTNWT